MKCRALFHSGCRPLYVNKHNKPKVVASTTLENQYERLKKSVTPFADKEYSQQLQTKEHLLRKALKKIYNIVSNNNKLVVAPAVHRQAEECVGQICPLKDVKPSPEIYGYRNKDEFSIGPGVDGKPTIGLFVGRPKYGPVVCVDPSHLAISSDRHKDVAKAYQDFMRSSPLGPCLDMRGGGHWRGVVIRSVRSGHTMMVARLHPRDRPQVVEQAREELLQYFCQGAGRSLGLDSLYLQPCQHQVTVGDCCVSTLVAGAPHLVEDLLGLRFRISPGAFFQTNTWGAEVLYSQVRDLVSAASHGVLLDICCGTGTMGILMADQVAMVMGVERGSAAVADAHFNARLNGKDNVSFHCGMALRALPELLAQLQTPQLSAVGILNPGRAGIDNRVIDAIRGCAAIKSLVYVSCKPQGHALRNMVQLMREGERLGQPFVPRQAVGVDLFPHTLHCELILHFHR